MPLVRSWELARRPGKKTIWIQPVVDSTKHVIKYLIREGGTPQEPSVVKGNGTCIATGSPIPGGYIKQEANAGRMGSVLIAIVAESGRGKKYLAPDSDGITFDVPEIPSPIQGSVPRHLTGGTCAVYGLDEWRKLFTRRQLLALSTFSDLLLEVRSQIEEQSVTSDGNDTPFRLGGSGSTAYADAVITYLAFVIDKCADYWSSLTTWASSGGFIRNTFARQAIPMTWDFTETNPFSSSTGSWNAMVDWVVKVVDTFDVSNFGVTAQRDAASRLSEIGKCVLATDPPYYDNISYADLSDFFYVWMRRNLQTTWPDEFATIATPKAEELIANSHRAGSKSAAIAHFENGMGRVFHSAADNSDERYPATIFYAFKATESSDEGVTSTGWETFLSALLDAGFAVTATWPMRTELGSRMIASGTNALASSIVLACRKRKVTAPLATRAEFIAALRSEMSPAVRILQEQNIAPVDMSQSAMGPGIAIFSRYSKVLESDGSEMTVRSALFLINEVLSEVLSGEESELDPITRFALTWFEQFGYSLGQFGDADTLARAKNTSVDGAKQSGIIASHEGRVRLLERKETPQDWDPKTDSRLTVWESTQYLIRALESSETEAAELIRQLGSGMGERARQLAYLLYGISDRKKWAEEAGAYNMLVTAWPEIERLARQIGNSEKSTNSLF